MKSFIIQSFHCHYIHAFTDKDMISENGNILKSFASHSIVYLHLSNAFVILSNMNLQVGEDLGLLETEKALNLQFESLKKEKTERKNILEVYF